MLQSGINEIEAETSMHSKKIKAVTSDDSSDLTPASVDSWNRNRVIMNFFLIMNFPAEFCEVLNDFLCKEYAKNKTAKTTEKIKNHCKNR